ncbi:MAG TPA: heavy-metal-associated domain-containing protein [Lacisediminihabitans sp.]|uniref:heavy-metal-associated domain-containing protein n=1 Tax=Lacisediminihabitans sp. TaxID=2787631 RepID=UPI002ED7B7B4
MTTTDAGFTDLGLTGKNSAGHQGGGCGGEGCTCGANAAERVESATASIVSSEYLVSGMTCEHCVASVTEELSEVDGVESVTVSLNPGGASTVTVGSAAPVDRASVAAAIEEAGYTLVDASR